MYTNESLKTCRMSGVNLTEVEIKINEEVLKCILDPKKVLRF